MSEEGKDGKVCPPCGKFEPQAWRKSICRNCFHTTGEHTERNDSSAPKTVTPPTTVADKVGKPQGVKGSVSVTNSTKTSENKLKVVLDKNKSKSISPEKVVDTSRQQPPLKSDGTTHEKETSTSLFKTKYERLSESVNQGKTAGPKEPPPKVTGGLAAKFTDKYEKLGGGTAGGGTAAAGGGGAGAGGGVSAPPAKTAPAKPPPPPTLPKTKGRGAAVDKKDSDNKQSSKPPETDDTSGWKTLPRSKKEAKKEEKVEPPAPEKPLSFKDKYQALTMKTKFGSAENIPGSTVDITIKSKMNAGVKLKFGSADNVSLQKDNKQPSLSPSPRVGDKPWDLSKLKSGNKDKEGMVKSSSLQDVASHKVTVEISIPKVSDKGSHRAVGVSVKGANIEPVKSKETITLKKNESESMVTKDIQKTVENKGMLTKSKSELEVKEKQKGTLPAAAHKDVSKSGAEKDSKSPSKEPVLKVDTKDSKTTLEKDSRFELKSKSDEKDKKPAPKPEESKKTDFKTKFDKDPKSELKSKYEEKDKTLLSKVDEVKKTDKVDSKQKLEKDSKSNLASKVDDVKGKGTLSKGEDAKAADNKVEPKTKAAGIKINIGGKQTAPDTKSKEDEKSKKFELKSKSEDTKSKTEDKDKKPAWKLKLEEREKKSEPKTKVEEKSKAEEKDNRPAWKIKLEERNSSKSKVDDKKTGVKPKSDEKDSKAELKPKSDEKDSKTELKSKFDEKDSKTEVKSKFDKRFDFKSKAEDKPKSGFQKNDSKTKEREKETIEKTPSNKSKAKDETDSVKSKTTSTNIQLSGKAEQKDSKKSLVESKLESKSDSKLPEVTEKEKSPAKMTFPDPGHTRNVSPFANTSSASNAATDDVSDARAVGGTRLTAQSDFTGSAKPALYVDTQVFTSSKSKTAGLEVADSGSGSSSREKKADLSKEISSTDISEKSTVKATEKVEKKSNKSAEQNGELKHDSRVGLETWKNEGDISGAASARNGTSQFIADIERLKLDLKIMAEKCQNLEIENEAFRKDVGTKAMAEAGLKKQKEEVDGAFKGLQKQLSSLEETCSKLETDNSNLMVKLKAHQDDNKDKPVTKETEETRQRLVEREEMCEELTDENETLKQEVLDLKVEMEEMYDSFRDQEAEEFRELQKELEITAKNCRILQFKMRKAERRNEQIEHDRNQFEQKLRLLQNHFEDKDAVSHIKSLEQELKMAKDVSVRLHDELDLIDDKRGKMEDENRQLTELLEQADRKQFRLEMEVDKLRDQLMDMKRELVSKGGRPDEQTERKFRY